MHSLGEVAIHLCLMACAHRQEILKACGLMIMIARRMQQQHLVLLGMALVLFNRQARSLEPPMRSSLAAKEMMLAPGEVAIHLCLRHVPTPC